jgi:hypothetical protein
MLPLGGLHVKYATWNLGTVELVDGILLERGSRGEQPFRRHNSSHLSLVHPRYVPVRFSSVLLCSRLGTAIRLETVPHDL